MKNKKILILLTILTILVFVIIFIFFNYKNIKNGNNITNKSEDDIKKIILNISSYSAKIDVEVQTNKNRTKYIVRQTLKDNNSYQEVIQPENIAGVITKYDGNKLTIANSKLDLTTTYENYQYIVNNSWWLNSFIKEFKDNKDSLITSNEKEIIFELKNEENNKYNIYKTLYVDKNTSKPTKLIVRDINKNTTIYIVYTEIEIS